MKKVLIATIILLSAIIFVGCSDEPTAKTVDLDATLTQINTDCNIENAEKYEIEDLNTYYLIEESLVKSFAGEIDKEGLTEIVLIEATDEESATTVSEKLNERLTSRKSEVASYNAENYDLIKDAEIKLDGNYVSMILTEELDTANSIYTDAIK